MNPDPVLPATAQTASVTAWRGGTASVHTDWLAAEVPVALVFNGLSHAVMLATPADLADFALGFAFTEGLLTDPTELRGVDVHPVPAGALEGLELRLEVSAACAWRLRERRRVLAGRTGCGLCGTESLAQVLRPLPTLPARRVSVPALARAQTQLREQQVLQQRTGAAHAAAWCTPDGTVHVVREDIGRHNALDKLIGALLHGRHPVGEGFVCVTSRASFEMVQKTAAAGIGLLAAASAPTSLAVHTAQRAGLALAGFVRGGDAVAYTYPERFTPSDHGP